MQIIRAFRLVLWCVSVDSEGSARPRDSPGVLCAIIRQNRITVSLVVLLSLLPSLGVLIHSLVKHNLIERQVIANALGKIRRSIRKFSTRLSGGTAKHTIGVYV